MRRYRQGVSQVNIYARAAIRAMVIVALVLLLVGDLLGRVGPETRVPPTVGEQFITAFSVFALAFFCCLKTKLWIVTLLLVISYSFAQLAASSPVGSSLSKWLWLGFVLSGLPTTVLSIYWALQLRNANIRGNENV